LGINKLLNGLTHGDYESASTSLPFNDFWFDDMTEISVDNETILGFPVTRLSLDNCLDLIESWTHERSARYLVCANPHSLVTARTDPEFVDAILKADLVTPDGFGVVLASRCLGGDLRSRITGTDIFLGTCQRLNDGNNRSCFLLGTSTDNLQAIERQMAVDFPNLRVAGMYSPPFKDEFDTADSAAMIKAVNTASPDVLWVAMTAPKQEKWVFANRHQLRAGFIGPIGAVFDYYTGRVKRAHPFLQRVGLEWLPRFLQEPRRLWRRNMVSTPFFMAKIARAWCRKQFER
jgi:N-acetylglucosaminyldiphosphoundecaprenol N-acetyl-beta-D-mannosaminyltransferase